MKMKYGTMAQLRNIIRWLQNYQETGYRLCDVTPEMSDKQIQEHERKLRADSFVPPKNVESLIEELQHILHGYHEGMTLEEIQSEWKVIKPRLKQIFHEERVLPELILDRIPANE